MVKEINESKHFDSKEIDLLELLKKTWKNRKVIFTCMAFFFLLGIIVILITPKEYKSDVVLIVETSSTSSGMSGLLQQFGGLTGLGNFGATMSEDALTPELYPDIVKSTPFLLSVLNVSITDSKHDSTLRVSEFLDRHTRQKPGKLLVNYTLGLPGKIIGLFSRKSNEYVNQDIDITSTPLKLTPKQSSLIGELSKRIKAIQGELPNTLIISVEMQDPQLVAQLADSVIRSLTAYVIDYRTQKAKADLQFVEQSHYEAEKKFRVAQRALAAFKDRNMNIATASAQITEQNLQSEYTLAFNIYSTLSQQLEQSKMKVQEKTPVFKVMEPAKIPLYKYKPKTFFILLATLFFGGLIGVVLAAGKGSWSQLLKH